MPRPPEPCESAFVRLIFPFPGGKSPSKVPYQPGAEGYHATSLWPQIANPLAAANISTCNYAYRNTHFSHLLSPKTS